MKGTWYICVRSYEVDGIEVSKGRMHYHTSTIPIMNDAWRKATDHEIAGMKWHRGMNYNLEPFI